MQTELLQKDLKTVGEAISPELGAQMIADYRTANPTDSKKLLCLAVKSLNQILAQPGCVGIYAFYNAYKRTRLQNPCICRVLML